MHILLEQAMSTWPTYLERLKEADTSEPKEIWIHHLTNEFEKNYTAKKTTMYEDDMKTD